MFPGSQEWCYAHYGDPDSPGWAEKNLVTINFLGRDLRVHRHAARAFLHLEKQFRHYAPHYAKHVHDNVDDWGWSNRYIAGTTVKSLHAFGIAIDINALTNVRGSHGDMPSSVIVHAARVGIVNGRSWSNPDAMHFEVHLEPADVRDMFDKEGNLK